jgi:hypothetical protein
MIRIEQGRRWVRSRHTEYITILAALFDRITMAVDSGDRKKPQQYCMEWPQMADVYAVSQGKRNTSSAMQQQVTCCQGVKG